MGGYIKCSQWHGVGAKHVSDIVDVEKHKGDGTSVDKLLGFRAPGVVTVEPECNLGEVVFRVEEDGSLTLHKARYDSGD